MTTPRIVPCRECGTTMDIAGHFGRPPVWCSAMCRREGRISIERERRARHRAEVAKLRELVARLTGAQVA